VVVELMAYVTMKDLQAAGVVSTEANAWADFAKRMKSDNGPIVIPADWVKVEYVATPNCTTCGTFAGCVCPRSPVSMTAHCYLCDAQHDPRVQAPRVCDACRRRYL
jgi:hypothetical protein